LFIATFARFTTCDNFNFISRFFVVVTSLIHGQPKQRHRPNSIIKFTKAPMSDDKKLLQNLPYAVVMLSLRPSDDSRTDLYILPVFYYLLFFNN